MDYVREELLRQQALLSVLMNGVSSEREREDESSRTERRTALEQSLRKASAGTGLLGESGRGDGPETEALRVRVSDDEAVPEGNRAAGRRTTGTAAGRTASLSRRERGSGSAGRAGSGPAGGAGTGGGRWVSVSRQTAGKSADPQAVSRAIQRDARRYDGGFTIY